MTAASRSSRRGRQAGSRTLCRRSAGVATIEFAIIAVVAIVIMQFCWWAGRAYWQRSLLEAAARDAARLIASTPPGELTSSSQFNTAIANANALVEAAVQESGIDFAGLDIACDGSIVCNSAVGLRVIRLEAEALLPETVFPALGGDGLAVTVSVEVPYDGRFAFH
ncbi:TadE/TadG family type IV pilus assembly protein [Pseudoduganella sp. GCM10020061]|uniref:TadE/TadG family type IV pilus assembly protein n=1 Tax=Pseudoduganella sp. GCM10020061 TaxID=3317345 RepID=UPI0036376811